MAHISSNQEDYLKTIYLENLKGNLITNKLISDKMNVSAPSVSDMMNKLIKAKYLKKDDEYGYKLTEEGISLTQTLLKKHRLWEVFLIEKLGYSWDEVHEDADALEHVTSSKLVEKLNEFLGEPKFCPHGKVIYGNGIEENFKSVIKMSELKVNEKGSVHIIDDDMLLLQYLANKNIKIHDEFTVEGIDEFDKTLILNIQGQKSEISAQAAAMIYVRR